MAISKTVQFLSTHYQNYRTWKWFWQLEHNSVLNTISTWCSILPDTHYHAILIFYQLFFIPLLIPDHVNHLMCP